MTWTPEMLAEARRQGAPVRPSRRKKKPKKPRPKTPPKQSSSAAADIEIAAINRRLFEICDLLDIASTYQRAVLLEESAALVARKNILERR